MVCFTPDKDHVRFEGKNKQTNRQRSLLTPLFFQYSFCVKRCITIQINQKKMNLHHLIPQNLIANPKSCFGVLSRIVAPWILGVWRTPGTRLWWRHEHNTPQFSSLLGIDNTSLWFCLHSGLTMVHIAPKHNTPYQSEILIAALLAPDRVQSDERWPQTVLLLEDVPLRNDGLVLAGRFRELPSFRFQPLSIWGSQGCKWGHPRRPQPRSTFHERREHPCQLAQQLDLGVPACFSSLGQLPGASPGLPWCRRGEGEIDWMTQ